MNKPNRAFEHELEQHIRRVLQAHRNAQRQGKTSNSYVNIDKLALKHNINRHELDQAVADCIAAASLDHSNNWYIHISRMIYSLRDSNTNDDIDNNIPRQEALF